MPKISTEKKLEIIKNDFSLWARNFIKIVDNNGDEVPFILNDQQTKLFKSMDKFNLILKSRQLGFTTFSIAYCLFIACNKSNVTCLILSYNNESMQEIFERLKGMYARIPDKYKPKEKRNNKMELSLENGSRVVVKVAGNKELGRGFTCEYIHCSEFAFWSEYAQTKGLLGLEQALAKNENSRLIIETTANGMNYFFDMWKNASKKKSKYKPFFFGWIENKTQFAKEYDIAEKWFRETNHGRRLYSKDLTSTEEKELYANGASLKQIMWFHYKRQDMTEGEFCQEYPATPHEAFITTNDSVFEIKNIIERLNYLPEPLTKDELLNDLPDSLKRYLNRGLYIFAIPKRNIKYYGGVDTSAGGGGDYSTITILDSDGQQVASFYSNKVPVYKFAEIVNDLGRYFYYAFLVVERNSYGLPLLERLRREYQYMNLYKHKIFNERGKKVMQLGWSTTAVSKSILITDFKEMFELGSINLNCRETLEQMQIFQEKDGKLNNKRGDNNHDDLVISSALAVQGIKTNKWYV